MQTNLNLNFHQIHLLMEIKEQKSMTKAAKTCYVSQPYLSKFIAGLEIQLGFKLFFRTKSALELTNAGELFFEWLHCLSDAVRTFDRDISILQSHLAAQKGLVFGLPLSVSTNYLHSVLSAFYAQNPDIPIRSVEGTSQQLTTQCLSGAIDVAITGDITFPSGISSRVVSSEPILLVVPMDCPFSCPQAVNNYAAPVPLPASAHSYLQNATFILTSEEQGIGQAARRLLKKHKIVPQKTIDTQGPDVAFSLAASGFGISFVISSLAPVCVNLYKQDVCFFTISDPPEHWTRYFIFRPDKNLSKAECDLLNICIRIFNQ